MKDTGYKAFLAVCPRVFRVETSWKDGGSVATGFSVARLMKSNCLILATAGHVLQFSEGEPVEWLVQQFDDEGRLARETRFTTTGPDGENRYGWHNVMDIGWVVIPATDTEGKRFTLPDEVPLPLIDAKRRLCEGTRVGWAGFPWQVHEFQGHPQLCYFEGVVSAFCQRSKTTVYVVDGHNAPGVSGGPVWHWPEDGDGIQIAGVVSGYGRSEDRFPGFCVFVPINPLINYLRASCSTDKVQA
jgi:hypothetical protein